MTHARIIDAARVNVYPKKTARITVANAKLDGEANTAILVSVNSWNMLLSHIRCLRPAASLQPRLAGRNSIVTITWSTAAARRNLFEIRFAAAIAVPIAADLAAPRSAA